MKENVFSTELPDGGFRVYSTELDVSVEGDTLRQAADLFIQAVKDKGYFRITVEAAEPLETMLVTVPETVDTSRRKQKMNLVEKARAFATKKHEGQKRWGGEPYITHLEAVAQKVVLPTQLLSQERQAVAWLHDVMEDCGVTKEELLAEGFPPEVVEAVILLTKDEGEVVSVTTKREGISYADYIRKILSAEGRAGCMARVVKIADLKHNLETSTNHKGSLRDKWQLALWILRSGE